MARARGSRPSSDDANVAHARMPAPPRSSGLWCGLSYLKASYVHGSMKLYKGLSCRSWGECDGALRPDSYPVLSRRQPLGIRMSIFGSGYCPCVLHLLRARVLGGRGATTLTLRPNGRRTTLTCMHKSAGKLRGHERARQSAAAALPAARRAVGANQPCHGRVDVVGADAALDAGCWKGLAEHLARAEDVLEQDLHRVSSRAS